MFEKNILPSSLPVACLNFLILKLEAVFFSKNLMDFSHTPYWEEVSSYPGVRGAHVNDAKLVNNCKRDKAGSCT
jgi:hypothetical protein